MRTAKGRFQSTFQRSTAVGHLHYHPPFSTTTIATEPRIFASLARIARIYGPAKSFTGKSIGGIARIYGPAKSFTGKSIGITGYCHDGACRKAPTGRNVYPRVALAMLMESP
jgi:hypothetical protein